MFLTRVPFVRLLSKMLALLELLVSPRFTRTAVDGGVALLVYALVHSLHKIRGRLVLLVSPRFIHND